MNRQRAFSLIELLIVLALLGIFLGLAVPSFDTLLERTRQDAEVEQLVSLISFTRATAILQRRAVSLCAGGDTCDGAGRWQGQLLVFIDDNRNGQLDAGETLLRVQEMHSGLSWYWRNFRNREHLTFLPAGITHSLNGSFILCQQDTALKKIVINSAGRARRSALNADDRCA